MTAGLFLQVQNASAVIDRRGILFHSLNFGKVPAACVSFTGEKQLIGFVLKLLNRDFSTGMGLQMCVELIVLLHAAFAGRVR
ncbi:MAG: hypothetical protein AUF79_02555 [Crenarchaeota archaeon 13_1_20CM_2_51_8]|nr:MAG: hypothetical protein AUF79_02555 [Crenarchaeota archaeon 13_1_20CM_2_51_8]